VPSSRLPRDQPAFFVDRSLGYHLIPDMLGALGYEVHTMRSVFGAGAEERIPDTDWLEVAGQQDWIVLTKDARMRYRQAELQAIRDHRLRVFCLANAHLTGLQQADRIRANLSRMASRARRSGPWIDALYQGRVVRLWPRRPL
jgi:hypothetical protein